MIYMMLALLVYCLFQVPKMTQDLPYAQYQPKTARTAENDRQWINCAALWFTLGLLILFAGLRAKTVGVDLEYFYSKTWDRLVDTNGADHTYEWLYTLLSRVAYFVFRDPFGLTVVLTTCAAIIVLSVYFVGKRMTPDIGLLMFLMVACTLYLRGLNSMRQCTASALCVLATWFIYRKKPLWFAVCVILAAGFHRATGVLFLPMAVFFFAKSDLWQVLVWLEALFLGIVFVNFDHALVRMFGKMIGNTYYYDYYLAGNYGLVNWLPIHFVDTVVTWGCFIGFVVYKWWYRWRYHTRVSRQYDLFLNVYFFAALFYFLAQLSPQFYVYERLTVPFSWAGIFLVTNIIGNIQNPRLQKIVRVAVMVGALLYTYVLVYGSDHNILWYNVIG